MNKEYQVLPNYLEYNYQNYGLCSKQANAVCQLEELDAPSQAFLYANISRWLMSPVRKNMLTGEKYYNNQNDIVERERYYIGRRGEKIINPNVANSKVAHPFIKKLTNQKVDYLLSKDFTLNSDNENYLEILGADYLNQDFQNLLKRIGKEAICKGIAWVQVYYDEEGKLNFKLIPSEEIFPFWANSEHTELNGILRIYCTELYKADGTLFIQKQAEFYTTKGSWAFDIQEGNLIQTERKGHFLLNNKQTNWLKVPFVCFKYNADGVPLLNFVKPLIDAYDITVSDTNNLLQDVPNSIKVIKDYAKPPLKDGEEDDFTQNLAYFRAIFVRGDGDVKAIETPIDIQAIEGHLTRLKRDIYEAGSGVDNSTVENTSGAISGVALRQRYNELDQDCKAIENEFCFAINQLKYFIDTDLLAKSKGDFESVDFEITFNTNMITDEGETVQTIVQAYQAGLLSLDTALANNPMVADISIERAEIEKEAEQKKKDEQEQLELQTQQQIKLNQAKGKNQAK